MTGRAAGYCAGYPLPGYMNPVPGSGVWGWGRGGGRGWRNQFYATGLTGWQRGAVRQPVFAAGFGYGVPYAAPVAPSALSTEQEIDLLKRQAEYFANALEGIGKRIEELSARPQEK